MRAAAVVALIVIAIASLVALASRLGGGRRQHGEPVGQPWWKVVLEALVVMAVGIVVVLIVVLILD